MAADFSAAQEHFVPRNFMFNSNACKAIVIHKTGGDATPADVYRTFINSGNPGKSSHYAIGLDGSIWQFVPESLGAGANGIPGPNMEAFWQPYLAQYGNLNMCTISIEHCDPSPANNTPLTPAQKQASFALVAHLCAKYNIPPDHIKPHRSIAATDCPGTYPMDELIAYVRGDNTEMGIDINDAWVKTYFKQTSASPERWHCEKTGQDLFAGILAGWRAMNGAPRLPTGPETKCGDKAVYQQCESGILLYDPLKEIDAPSGPWAPCYLLKLGSDLAKHLLGVVPEPGLVDTTQAIADVQAIADDVASAVAAGVAKAVVTIKGLVSKSS